MTPTIIIITLMTMVIAQLERILPARNVFAGRRAGEADAAQVHARALATPTRVLVLDCAGTELITSSYFDAAIWPLWEADNPDGTPVFPIVANAKDDTLAELRMAMSAVRRGLWHVHYEDGVIRSPELVGFADDERDVLEYIESQPSATAQQLHTRDRKIGPTAWSNRLAQFYDCRVLDRRKSGRQYLYHVPWKEPSDG